jgi:hypothetical protein
MGSLSRQRGKRTELAVAKYWGCKRAHFESNDLHGHPCFTIEVKCRKTPIATLRSWMHQAINACEPGKAPMVQFHTLGDQIGDDLVIMRAKDLRDLVGKGVYGKEDE